MLDIRMMYTTKPKSKFLSLKAIINFILYRDEVLDNTFGYLIKKMYNGCLASILRTQFLV